MSEDYDRLKAQKDEIVARHACDHHVTEARALNEIAHACDNHRTDDSPLTGNAALAQQLADALENAASLNHQVECDLADIQRLAKEKVNLQVELATAREVLEDLRQLAWANKTDDDVDSLGTFDIIIRENAAFVQQLTDLRAECTLLHEANRRAEQAVTDANLRADKMSADLEWYMANTVVRDLRQELETANVTIAQAEAEIVRLRGLRTSDYLTGPWSDEACAAVADIEAQFDIELISTSHHVEFVTECERLTGRLAQVEAENCQWKVTFDNQQLARQADACTECKGTGEVGYMTETELGPEGDSQECSACFGSGSQAMADKLDAFIASENAAWEEKLAAANAELERLNQPACSPPCDPQWDATDGACGCWWRGDDHGAVKVAQLVMAWPGIPDGLKQRLLPITPLSGNIEMAQPAGADREEATDTRRERELPSAEADAAESSRSTSDCTTVNVAPPAGISQNQGGANQTHDYSGFLLWKRAGSEDYRWSTVQPDCNWHTYPTMYEDELPRYMPSDAYDQWFTNSAIVNGVRQGPRL